MRLSVTSISSGYNARCDVVSPLALYQTKQAAQAPFSSFWMFLGHMFYHFLHFSGTQALSFCFSMSACN